MQGFWRQLYFPGVKDEVFLTEREKREAARAILIDGGKKPSEITDKDIDDKIENIAEI
jgi:hypothetical protein